MTKSRKVRTTDAGDAIARLASELADRDATIARQTAEIAHARSIFREASVAARLGVWECTLPDQRLTWSDGVYEIFDLSPDKPLKREDIVRFYAPQARIEMERLRTEAILTRTGFPYEAEIFTARGRRKWMRITARIECVADEPVRIFGIKQDVTAERLLLDRTRFLAEYDPLTGLANRGQFQERLEEIDMARIGRAPYSALILIDIDHFKAINDTYGHPVGDQCLIEAARRLKLHCASARHIARIGGDEFAILLQPGLSPAECDAAGVELLAAFRDGEPVAGTTIRLTASIGLAASEGLGSRQVFLDADAALYAAKEAGRNRLRCFSADLAGERGRACR